MARKALRILVPLLISGLLLLLGFPSLFPAASTYAITLGLTVITILLFLLAIPPVYQALYWLTYLSALAGLFTVAGTLLWYHRARKRFSSPIKPSGPSAVALVLGVIVTVAVTQLLISLLQREILYQISFGLFVVSIIVLGARTLINVSTSLAYRAAPKGSSAQPLVSVIVPAYNEAVMIKKTLQALLGLRYPAIEIIAVDDGSTDATLRIMTGLAQDSSLTVLHKPNGGKWSALNHGIKAAKGELIVCIDADTILDPDAITRLIPHFVDPRVAAVAGNIKVGNRRNLLTHLQALEYVTGLNIQRRSEAFFGRVVVVPGPLGAFRASVLHDVGLYTNDTFAEDADLTLKILKAGHRIRYEKHALGYTEAPSTLLDLGKQRYRWYRGILQSLTKHTSLLFNPRYGSMGLFMYPWMIFNSLLFSGFTFFTLIWLLVLMFNPVSGFVIYQPNPRGPSFTPPRGNPPGGGNNGPGNAFLAPPSPEFLLQIDFFQAIPLFYIFLFGVFFILEVGVALFAVAMDIKEKPRLVLLVVLQKLFYGYFVDLLRILSQIEQALHYPMKWETAQRLGVPNPHV